MTQAEYDAHWQLLEGIGREAYALIVQRAREAGIPEDDVGYLFMLTRHVDGMCVVSIQGDLEPEHVVEILEHNIRENRFTPMPEEH